MTDEQKSRAASWSLATLVAAVTLAGPAWPIVEKALLFLGPIVAREQVQAILAAWASSLFLALSVPYLLPGSWPAVRTHIVVGLIGAASAAVVAFNLSPMTPRMAATYAFLAAVGTVTVNRVLLAGLFKLAPKLRPRSLLP